MLQRRTDLAVESVDPSAGKLEGIKTSEALREGYRVVTVEVMTPEAAQKVGKPVGKYVTLELGGLARRETDAFPRACRALSEELSSMLTLPEGAPVLVVGLGNRAITPDAVGPLAHEHTLVTRHLVAQLPEQFGAFRPVSALATGVLGTTGVESGELVSAVVERTQPACVIAIDALAARDLNRLCTTVQIANTGITPGSGVGNHRGSLDQESLGVPVIAVGVPTVVDGATLAMDLLEEAGKTDLDPKTLSGKGADLFVTPKDIDVRVQDAAKVIGYGINMALNTGLSVADVEMFLE